MKLHKLEGAARKARVEAVAAERKLREAERKAKPAQAKLPLAKRQYKLARKAAKEARRAARRTQQQVDVEREVFEKASARAAKAEAKAAKMRKKAAKKNKDKTIPAVRTRGNRTRAKKNGHPAPTSRSNIKRSPAPSKLPALKQTSRSPVMNLQAKGGPNFRVPRDSGERAVSKPASSASGATAGPAKTPENEPEMGP